MLNRLLDLSVIYSFDRTGFERHARTFSPLTTDAFCGKRCLITGGSSGIGAALALQLARGGAQVLITGRDQQKFTDSPLAAAGVRFAALDMADFSAVMQTALALPEIQSGPQADSHSGEQRKGGFDAVVCNAGGMPESLKLVGEQYDEIFASQLIGHYLLIRRCMQQRLIKPGGLFHITTSGGMYLQKLSLDDLCWQQRQYNKVTSYANAKRAQVVLTRQLASAYPEYHFACSHPGWVGTQALAEALPGFTAWLGRRLRSAEQGADTIAWCLAEGQKLPTGQLWFDRKRRNPAPLPWTRESQATRSQLWQLCQRAWSACTDDSLRAE